ncbi:MAG: DNA primase small subunit domain-containing protein [Nitrososphaerota archaeon]
MKARTESSMLFVKKIFREHYRSRPEFISPPPRTEAREFGYWSFDLGEMTRHLSFRSPEEVRAEIIRVAPLHAYRSAAYYQYPSAPMEEKGWAGADIIFDIDADHLDLPCVSQHVYHVCSTHGLVIEHDKTCPRCGRELMEVDWVCDTCLSAARAEANRLAEILIDEFGVGIGEVEVGFSGNRGYHLVVYSPDYLELDQMARKNLVSYLTCVGFVPRLLGLPGGDGARGRPRLDLLPPPRFDESGWYGRIVKRIYSLLQRPEELSGLGKYARYVDDVREAWSVEPDWGVAPYGFWAVLVQEAVRRESLRIDPVVTTDVHRLLRLSGTLNGKTGLLAGRINLEMLEDFDPLREFVVLPRDRRVRVRVSYSPAFNLGGEEFDEVLEPRSIELPIYAAVYLILKGLAVLEAG